MLYHETSEPQIYSAYSLIMHFRDERNAKGISAVLLYDHNFHEVFKGRSD
jgi:hypothetical protein